MVCVTRDTLATLNNTISHQYVKRNKAKDEDWFKLESNADGTRWVWAPRTRLAGLLEHTFMRTPHLQRWFGTCWTFIEGIKYDFEVEFDVRIACTASLSMVGLKNDVLLSLSRSQ